MPVLVNGVWQPTIVKSTSEVAEEKKWTKLNYNPEAPENRFPMMLFKAGKLPDGRITVVEPEPNPSHYKDPAEYTADCNEVNVWNRAHTKTIGEAVGIGVSQGKGASDLVPELNRAEREYQEAREGGWVESIPEAIAKVKAAEDYKSEVTAHRKYEDRNLSDLAKAEAAKIESASDEHMPEIPMQPKRRGRPPKHAA